MLLSTPGPGLLDLRLLLPSALLLALPQGGLADDAPIDEIAVTATPRPASYRDISAALSRVPDGAVDANPLTTDALQGSVGVTLQRTTPGQGAAIIRLGLFHHQRRRAAHESPRDRGRRPDRFFVWLRPDHYLIETAFGTAMESFLSLPRSADPRIPRIGHRRGRRPACPFSLISRKTEARQARTPENAGVPPAPPNFPIRRPPRRRPRSVCAPPSI